ncbi:vesicle-associated membrane protein 5 isoform X2 [Stegostoma tigrinum]|uniref:vesicle-associated membrane protein 5 isoform X2 n=1 Tax=Stegostoma tigrinum TaxID=3053191 RepID=UPI00286FBA6D|nr:vesicle-associated membrane protein 5 isoform X2 [Stegostoma tigrinum]
MLQRQTDEVVEVMYANARKVTERGGKLEVLDDRAEKLQEAGRLFQKTAKQVAVQEASRNRRWRIIVGAAMALTVLAIVVIIAAVLATASQKSPRPADARVQMAVVTTTPNRL